MGLSTRDRSGRSSAGTLVLTRLIRVVRHRADLLIDGDRVDVRPGPDAVRARELLLPRLLVAAALHDLRALEAARTLAVASVGIRAATAARAVHRELGATIDP